jgi:hypothetical protein
MRALVAATLLVACPVLAQKPWEQRVDIAVPVPVELPAIPPSNPFAMASDTLASALQTPLNEDFEGMFPVTVAGYVDAKGICRRAVVTYSSLPGIAAPVTNEIAETRFTPAMLAGTAVATWTTLGLELVGRINEGSVVRVQSLAPNPSVPTQPDPGTTVGPEERDLQLPATPVENLEQLPSPKRFRVRTGSLGFKHSIRLLAEVSERGVCERVVFLSCPDGLRGWLLASLGNWSFRPALRQGSAVTTWVILEADLDVETSSLSTDTLRVLRQNPLAATGP